MAIANAMQPMVDNETEDRARNQVAKGDYSRAAGGTRQDELFNAIVDAGFMAQGATDVEKLIGEVELKHQSDLNVEEFAADMDAARTLYLEGIDSRYAVPLGQAWNQRALGATKRITELSTQRAVTRGIEAQKGRQGLLLDQLSGASNVEDPEIATRLDELQALLTARVANPEDGLTQEEADAVILNAVSKIQANRIGDEALNDYIEGGMTDEAYAASLKRIDDAMADPKLALDRTERSAFLGTARQALNSARSEKDREERELRAAIRDAQRDAGLDLASELPDVRARVTAGAPIAADELSELMRLAVASGKQSNVDKVNSIAISVQVGQQMRGLSMPQQEQYLNQIRVAAARGDVEAARQLPVAESLASRSLAAAKDDPASYAAIVEGRDVPVVDWSDPNKAVAGLTRRFNEAEVAGSSLGVDVKYFSPADRAALRSITEKGGAPALQFAARIYEAADQAGVDPITVFEELGGDAPLMTIAGGLMSQGVPDAPALVLSGPAVMQSETVKGAMPGQSTQRSVQVSVLGNQLSTLPPTTIDALTRAADAHYAATLVQNGGKPPGGERAAYETSMRAVTGEWKDGSGKTWGGMADLGGGRQARAPAWISQKSFPAIVSGMGWNEWATALGLGDDGLLRNDGLMRGVDGAMRGATLADVRSALWVEVGPGRYYIAPDPKKPTALLMNSDGTPSMVDLNLSRDLLRKRQPDAVR